MGGEKAVGTGVERVVYLVAYWDVDWVDKTALTMVDAMVVDLVTMWVDERVALWDARLAVDLVVDLESI